MIRNLRINVMLALSIAGSGAFAGCLVGDESQPEAELGVVEVMGHGLELEYVRAETPDGDAVGMVGDMMLELPDKPLVARHGSLPSDEESILGVRSPSGLWPNGVVPYRIVSGMRDASRIHDAMKLWESKTNIRFVPHSTEPAYVFFHQDPNIYVAGFGVKRMENCFSGVGRGKRRGQYASSSNVAITRVSVPDFNCPSTSTVVHEIGHAVGLLHTHQRHDRDSHISIHWQNIGYFDGYNYNIARGVWLQNEADNGEYWNDPYMDVGPYRTDSFMHYPSNVGKAGWVLSTVAGGEVLRQRDITPEDAASINQLYSRAPSDYPYLPPESDRPGEGGGA